MADKEKTAEEMTDEEKDFQAFLDYEPKTGLGMLGKYGPTPEALAQVEKDRQMNEALLEQPRIKVGDNRWFVKGNIFPKQRASKG